MRILHSCERRRCACCERNGQIESRHTAETSTPAAFNFPAIPKLSLQRRIPHHASPLLCGSPCSPPAPPPPPKSAHTRGFQSPRNPQTLAATPHSSLRFSPVMRLAMLAAQNTNPPLRLFSQRRGFFGMKFKNRCYQSTLGIFEMLFWSSSSVGI